MAGSPLLVGRTEDRVSDDGAEALAWSSEDTDAQHRLVVSVCRAHQYRPREVDG